MRLVQEQHMSDRPRCEIEPGQPICETCPYHDTQECVDRHHIEPPRESSSGISWTINTPVLSGATYNGIWADEGSVATGELTVTAAVDGNMDAVTAPYVNIGPTFAPNENGDLEVPEGMDIRGNLRVHGGVHIEGDLEVDGNIILHGGRILRPAQEEEMIEDAAVSGEIGHVIEDAGGTVISEPDVVQITSMQHFEEVFGRPAEGPIEEALLNANNGPIQVERVPADVGNISDVRLYHTELTQEEINGIYEENANV